LLAVGERIDAQLPRDRPRSAVQVGERGRGHFTRGKIADPSFFNWPAQPIALTDTIVPDFPLANKSFNLAYAGNDGIRPARCRGGRRRWALPSECLPAVGGGWNDRFGGGH